MSSLQRIDRNAPPFVAPVYPSDSKIADLLESILFYSADIGPEEHRRSVRYSRSLVEFQYADYKIRINNGAGISLKCYREKTVNGKPEEDPIVEFILSIESVKPSTEASQEKIGRVTGMRLNGMDWVASGEINSEHAKELLKQCTPENRIEK